MNMKTMTAAEAKNGFGRYMDAVQREPVIITKKDRPVAVTISFEDAEDFVLLEQAKKAGEKGFVGVDASEAVLKAILNAPR